MWFKKLPRELKLAILFHSPIIHVALVFPMIMALRPSGFVEYGPSEQLVFDQLVEIIKKNYEKF